MMMRWCFQHADESGDMEIHIGKYCLCGFLNYPHRKSWSKIYTDYLHGNQVMCETCLPTRASLIEKLTLSTLKLSLTGLKSTNQSMPMWMSPTWTRQNGIFKLQMLMLILIGLKSINQIMPAWKSSHVLNAMTNMNYEKSKF